MHASSSLGLPVHKICSGASCGSPLMLESKRTSVAVPRSISDGEAIPVDLERMSVKLCEYLEFTLHGIEVCMAAILSERLLTWR